MDGSFDQRSSFLRWVVFLCGAICIAAIGISSRFYQLQRNEKQKRLAAEERLRGLNQQVRLLEEQAQELAEELREAKKVADDLARERDALAKMSPNIPRETTPAPGPSVAADVGPPEPVRSSRLTKAWNSFSADRLVTSMGQARDAAAETWTQFQNALVASASSGPSPEQTPSGETPTRLVGAVKKLPLTRLAAAASEVRRAARDVFFIARDQFAKNLQTAGRREAEEISPAPETTKLTATSEELREELEAVRQEKRELERQIAERTGTISGSVDVGEVQVATGRRFSGRVLVVNPKHNFVVIDVGKIHGLETGVVLIVHRGNRFIGKAQVIKVYEKMAAADLLADWMQEDVQVSDGVKKF